MDDHSVPRILCRSDHILSRKYIDPDVLKILYRLYDHGFLAYLVGGCVRDLLLGKTPKDFDVVTDAHPQQIHELFRNSRLIGRRFRLAHVFFKGGKYIEVSTFRRRSEFDEEAPGNMPRSENTFGTPAEDAFRRDITINGIFYNIADFSLVDYVGGLEDLHQGIIRCIGDPQEKFVHDPVRMIRVIRHAARTGFHIEEKTLQSLMIHAEKIRLCSPARVRDEFLRELREGTTQESMHLMIESGMLFALFPSFHPFLNEVQQKEYFLNYISLLNGKDVSDHPYSDDFSLALFLRPLAEFFIPVEKFPPGRQGQVAFQQKIREWMVTILEPLQFKRHTQEAAAQLLGFQRIFHEFSPYRRLPLRFQRNPHFSTAWYLFTLTERARGKEIEQMAQVPLGDGIWRKKKRRRRFRKKRVPRPEFRKNFPENLPRS